MESGQGSMRHRGIPQVVVRSMHRVSIKKTGRVYA